MFLASKGFVQLQVKLNHEVKIVPFVSVAELKYSAKVIARSIASILNFHLKHATYSNKETAAKEYLESKGWKVETNSSHPESGSYH